MKSNDEQSGLKCIRLIENKYNHANQINRVFFSQITYLNGNVKVYLKH